MAQGQLGLPLEGHESFARERYVVGSSNREALAFLESWPNWKLPALAVHGPAGAGKSHLAGIWKDLSGAEILSQDDLLARRFPATPLIVEDCELLVEDRVFAFAVFHLLERASVAAPLLLTGRRRPAEWRCALPDLHSRLSALPAIFVDMPDDRMLEGIANKLFADRQLMVPAAVVERILTTVERSPRAIKDFVAEIDAMALARSRAVNLGLVREMLATRERGIR